MIFQGIKKITILDEYFVCGILWGFFVNKSVYKFVAYYGSLMWL